METINETEINTNMKICTARKSPKCVILGDKSMFNAGRCCRECLAINNKEYYLLHQAKYKDKSKENMRKKRKKIFEMKLSEISDI